MINFSTIQLNVILPNIEKKIAYFKNLFR